MPFFVISSLVSGIMALVLYRQWQKRKHNPHALPLPPGPPGQFLLGNLRELPRNGNEWIAYKQLSKRYDSDIIYLDVFGKSILAINSLRAANDLLDKKGSIYSDRPRLPMIKELTGWKWNLVLMSYHEGFHDHRRLVQQKFQQQVVETSYRSVMHREVKVLLAKLVAKPDDFSRHLKSMTAAIIMMVTYGHQVNSEDDEYVFLAEEVRRTGAKATGATLVDMLPFIKYLPTWLPGTSFKREALYKKELATQMREAPYQMVKERLAAGTAIPCVVSELIEESFTSEGKYDARIIKNCGGVVYSAGADTTAAALLNFILAMMLYPTVQKTAQEEIDRVIGRDRLVDFEDRPQLPYLGCIVKETLRWQSVTPLGVPHCNTVDDEYRGKHIPQATTVVANIWAMLHDESIYDRPEEFIPERYISSEGKPEALDPRAAAFGFGRRICPGRFFAEDSIWLAMASILQIFDISKPIGVDVELDKIQWSSGLVSLPSSFPCQLSPRSPNLEYLVALNLPVSE